MHWEVQYPEPKEPKPRPFDFYDVIKHMSQVEELIG